MKVKEVNLQIAVANKNVVTLQDIEACIIKNYRLRYERKK